MSGFEPEKTVLETVVIPFHYTPLPLNYTKYGKIREMESGQEGSSHSEHKEISGGWYLEPNIHVIFSTRQPAGGYLVNEIFALAEGKQEVTGLVKWKSGQPMILKNKGIKEIRKIKAGVEFLTLKCDLNCDPVNKKISPR